MLLATLDVPFAEEAIVFAVDSAVESGQPLVVVNAAQVLPTTWSLLGYGYIEREDLQSDLLRPAQLAHSLAAQVERLPALDGRVDREDGCVLGEGNVERGQEYGAAAACGEE